MSIIHKIDKKYIIALLLLVLLLFVFFMVKYQQEKQEIKVIIDYEKEKLESEYNDWSFQNETTNFTMGNDSLLSLLDKEQEKIRYLLEKIKIMESTNLQKFNELRKELDKTRETAKYYIRQVDSLNTINRNLQAENTRIRKRNQEVESSLQKLTEETRSLSTQVAKAATLEIRNIQLTGLTATGNKTSVPQRMENLQGCFRIAQNKLSSVGKKDLFLRFTGPDGNLFESAAQGKTTFRFENKEIGFSARKNVEYAGEDIEVCLFWPAVQPMESGSYRIEIFADGFIVAEKEMEL